ncbi:hypothetical protein [Pseudalkalibacillus caeni]|uniref:Uncharacterized protein n=1 Tax=Exobacillus caeni TaxID=2574798 RepID=A0A5R9F9L1_9BACL|nr:hypothetical protein [Pseudalkalibacillus caeni]TLS37553.1 hypothetical protein FCL54_10455 [Pseudalkalibacillus caeni]
MYKKMSDALEQVLSDWRLMETNLDQNTEVTVNFEENFYMFTNLLKEWMVTLEHPPETLEEAEEIAEIKAIEEKIPVPILVPFLIELDNIILEKQNHC